jgi:signal transduction histidine kinase
VTGAKSLIAPLEWQYRLLAMGLAAIPCYVLSWWLALPLLRLRRAMHKFGDGDLSARADPRRPDDFGDVAWAFNKMADRIQTLMGAERRLLRDVSHELRSPLARLQVAVEIARANGSDRLLDQVQQESERLDELIDQLLEWSKTEGRLCPAKTEAVRLDLLAARIADSCEIEADVRGCRLHLKTAPAITVSGTGELLHRAVENVLRNAVRFAPPDSAIEIAVASVGSEAHIVVRDYGPGVQEESLVRLFEPFYREPSNARDDRGLGLGLAIARRAVELHGGSIDASNAQPGLRVRIAIPVMATADNDANAVLVSKRA